MAINKIEGPMNWDQTTLEEVTFYDFPPQLDRANYINFEQDRLHSFQDRPSTSRIGSLDTDPKSSVNKRINRHNQIIVNAINYTARKYRGRVMCYGRIDYMARFIRQTVNDVVNFINNLYNREGHAILDPALKVWLGPKKRIVVDFDLLFKLSVENMQPVMYRNKLRIKFLPHPGFQLRICGFGFAEVPKVLRPKKPKSGTTKTFQQTLQNPDTSILSQKCVKNEDCPYFRGNRNYPNDFGGCNKATGYCQMPLGVEPLTYRLPRNIDEAICGNCKLGETDQCCGNQMVRSFYPRLASPDYRFEGDMFKRETNRETLAKRGLLP